MNRLEIKSCTSLEIHLNAFARILRLKEFLVLLSFAPSSCISLFLRLMLFSLLLLCFPMEDVRVLRDFPTTLAGRFDGDFFASKIDNFANKIRKLFRGLQAIRFRKVALLTLMCREAC